ncbi:MAG TPA: carboxypeptidase regulatory-like domain-containing protein [Terracidiphilus sp.]|nr:carboxypeptidase regulatory-like domain-containing protein [Terracidiphilus sp.]
MRNLLRTLSVLAGLLLLLPVMSVAQQSGAVFGGLNGTVVDSSSAVVTGATVTITGPQGSRTMVTDNMGHYAFTDLVPGYYEVKVDKSGFKTVKSLHNEVVVGVSSLLNVTLTIGSAQETVEVSASAVSIDTQSTAVDTNLTSAFYNNVPLPRAVSAIFYAAPGVAGGQVAGVANQVGPGTSNPSIGGSSGLENLYVVDGVTVTDQAYGSLGTFNSQHGSLGTGINLAFIQEVDVKSYGFAPQYGKAQGGIVQIVTKSGSDTFHGALGAYMNPGAWYAARKEFYQYGYIQTKPSGTLSSPHYDLAAELGGYIPGFKDKIFFFGAFNPSLDQNINIANPFFTYSGAPASGPPVVTHGPWPYDTTTLSWAGKLTFNPMQKLQLEIASFGDPSKHNVVPSTLSTSNIVSSESSYQWGSRDSLARLSYTITPSWVADVSYTYNYDHFVETPALQNYQILDQSAELLPSPGGQVNTGFGAFVGSREGTYSLLANTQKTFHFLGEHTVAVGYSYDHTKFLYTPERSGALFTLPDKNAAGTTLTSLFSNIRAPAGSMSNAIFTVTGTNANNLSDATCSQCPVWNGMRVYASIYRGTYVGLYVNSIERYHAAYGEDTWALNRFMTIDGGLRWEQERVAGSVLSYVFGGNWSPRLGLNIDPFGDRKGKIFINYGLNVWAMPLDAANRQLGNEQDDTAYVFAPTIQNGALVVVPDDAHNLNGMPKYTDTSDAVHTFGSPNFSSSTGEGIIPGTKSEYESEYVVGFEREIKNGFVAKARYVQRNLDRVIEDIGSQSPEGSTIGGNYTGGIANPSSKTDIAVNDQELTYTQAQFNTAEAVPMSQPGGLTKSNYLPVVPGCTAGNDTYFAAGGIFVDGNNTPLGGACFLNLATMDNGPGDGKADGFINPERKYQALELELDKRYSNHWLAAVNFRFGNLWGNYEGAYRNDNGQSDPGISSLFDFTAGQLNLLGDQFRPGYLSTDRRIVSNMFLSYTVDRSSPVIHDLKGLTTGIALRGQTGVPLSFLGDHPAYLNQGEVPLGGRGAAGRTPATLQLDLKGEYSLPIHERTVLKLALDALNVTDSQPITGKVEYTQQPANVVPVVGATPLLNKDYGRPTGFQGPFYARATIRLEF